MKRTIAVSIVWMVAALVGAGMACYGEGLMLSEIAWGGTAASSSDEWIEIRNASDETVRLAGWKVTFGDVVILLGEVGEDTIEATRAVLEPGAFLLLERTDDAAVSDVPADVLYKGTLSNSGMVIELLDPEGNVADSVHPVEEGAWPAGGGSGADVPYCTMERALTGEWTSNDGTIRNGLDADGNPLNGTPGKINSAEIVVLRAPTVDLLDPSVEGQVLSGMVIVSWNAHDPDGEDAALSISLTLSEDGGASWFRLIENLANTGSYSWNTGGVTAGDDYRLRIRAHDSDGYEGVAISPTFRIE